MVGETQDASEDDIKDEGLEEELYNLMRGYTSLLITDAAGGETDSEDDEEHPNQQVEEGVDQSEETLSEVTGAESTPVAPE